MTAVVTSLDHANTNGATTTVTTASVSPAASSTLVMFVSSWDAGVANTPLVSSVSGLSLNWRQVGHLAMNGTHGDLSCWTALCGASPGSGAITITTSTNVSAGNCYEVLQVAGGVVVGNNIVTGQRSLAAGTLTMGTALDTGNRYLYGLAAILNSAQTTTVTPATGYTELNDQFNSASGTGGVSLETQVSNDSTHATPGGTFGAGLNACHIGIEVGLATGVQWHQTGVGNRTTGAATSWNQYVAETDANTKVLVGVNMSISTNNTGATCGVTYDGVAMTQEGLVEFGATTSRGAIALYSLSNPPAGTKTVTVTPGGTPTRTSLMGNSVVYTGADVTTNFTSAATTGVTVTAAPLGIAFCVSSNGVTLGTQSGRLRYANGASVTGIGDFIQIQDAVPTGASVVFTNSGTATTPESLGISMAPPASTLVDYFATADATKWVIDAGITAVSSQINLPCIALYSTMHTLGAYGFVNSSASIQCVQTPNVGTGTTKTFFAAGKAPLDTSTSAVRIQWVADGTLRFYEFIAGVNTNTQITYDPVAHRFWRFRADATTTYWETSPDAVTWTTQRSKASGISMAELYVGIQSGYDGTETVPGTAIFDNLNAPAVAPPLPGHGALGATALAKFSRTASLPGQGVLAATVRAKFSVTPALAGHGVLSATATAKFSRTAALPGQGVLSATATSASQPSANTLYDDFASQNNTLWFYAAAATIVSGQLNLALNAISTGEIDSQNRYDLTGSSVTAQLVQPPNVGTGTTYTFVTLVLDGSNYERIGWGANLGGLFSTEVVAGVGSDQAMTGITDTWLRMRESGGTIFWDTSADGVSWTNRRSKAPAIALTNMLVYVQSGYFGTETLPGTAIWDHLNVPPRNPALPGHGVLAATATMYQVRTAGALPGHGALVATASAKFNTPAPLPGHGVLAATASMYRIASSAALPGHGTLTATTLAKFSRAPAIAGHGVLAATATASKFTLAGPLGGHGALAATDFPEFTRAVGLPGHGGLAATAVATRFTESAALLGHGTLTATASARFSATPALPGHGVLAATATMYRVARAATLAGTGVLSATTLSMISRAAALTGHGGLAASATMYRIARSAALPGTGTLTATVAPRFARTATPTGAGVLSAAARLYQTNVAPALHGTGTLAATAAPSLSRSPALAGTGTLSATARPRFTVSVALPGHGVLVAPSVAKFARIPALAGVGALSGTAFATKMSVGAAIGGHGSMNGVILKRAIFTAPITGHGALHAHATPPPILGRRLVVSASNRLLVLGGRVIMFQPSVEARTLSVEEAARTLTVETVMREVTVLYSARRVTVPASERVDLVA